MAEETVYASWFAEAENMDTSAERLEELARYPRLQPLVAANPATPASILKRLAKEQDVAVRRAVALNPNTPVDQLCLLAVEFPEEFLRNPVLPILNLTRPTFIEGLAFEAWCSLLRFEKISPAWIKLIRDDRRYFYSKSTERALMDLHVSQIPAGGPDQALRPQDVRRIYLKNLPDLKRLKLEEETELFLLVVLLFPHLSPLLNKQWQAATSVAPLRVAELLAFTKQPGTKTLAALAQVSNPLILSQVARHPASPQRFLKGLAIYKRSVPDATRALQAVYNAAANNAHTPLETLYALASAKEPYVRAIAARHAALEPRDRSILALDEDATVRAALASFPHLTAELFTTLVQDTSPIVRAALARNVKIPPALLSTLAIDPQPAVREAAAGNPRLPLEAQVTLMADAVEDVRVSLSRHARLRVDHAEKLSRDLSPRVRAALAANPRTPVSLLPVLLHAEEPEVWAGLAHHPRLAPEMLTLLAHQGDARTRLAVAAHTRTPVETLAELAQDRTHAMWCALASNPNTPLNVLEQALPTNDIGLLYRLREHPAMTHVHHRPLLALLAERLQPLVAAHSVPNWLRKALLQYFNALPIELVSLFVISPYWQERYLLATRPHTPEVVLQRLAQDGIYPVREAARKRLEERQRTKGH
jgi:hypothetical protein